MIDYRAQLDSAGYAVRDKVGQVLSTGSRIIGYRDRAARYQSSGEARTVSLANAVVAKASGLLDNYRSIETDALKATGRANDLRTKMETDPTWKAILEDPAALMAKAGWGSVAVINSMIAGAVNTISDLASLSLRADKHLKAVNDLSSNADDLDAYAQGKGLTAKLDAVTGVGATLTNLAGNYLSFAKYAAVAVGLFFVWDIAKPLVSGRKVYSNPRRRCRK